MSQIVSDNILATIYLLMWIFTFIWYQHKNSTIDAGSTIIIAYIVYAVFSLLSLNDVFFSVAYNPLRFFPYFYLYTMLMIALLPAIYNHINPVTSIEKPITRVLKYISIIIFLCSVLQIPDIMSNASSGIMKIITDSDAGKDAYMEQIEEAENSGSVIRNIPSIIYNSLSDITVFLCFYFMTLKKKNFWLICALVFSIFIGILIPITRGQRGGVISGILTAICGYMLFRRYISKGINWFVQRVGVVCMIAATLPIAAITISRFSKESLGIGGYVNWYVGQGSLYFNNYGLDPGGSRNGDRTLNLFKRLVDSSTPQNYVERREKYHNLDLDDNLFSTFVGDFTIDFGPVTAFVIFVLFNFLILLGIRSRDGTLKLHQILLLYFTLCVSIQGGMTLFSYSDSGNLRIVTMALLYAYLRYHELLLEKFPLITKSNNN